MFSVFSYLEYQTQFSRKNYRFKHIYYKILLNIFRNRFIELFIKQYSSNSTFNQTFKTKKQLQILKLLFCYLVIFKLSISSIVICGKPPPFPCFILLITNSPNLIASSLLAKLFLPSIAGIIS